MWSQITRYLPEFDSAVLTGFDDSDEPYSLRCRPRPENGQALHLGLGGTMPLLPGPACLLFHRHDENLWHLKSFVVRGRLAWENEAWLLYPEQFIPGVGIGGVMSYVRFLVNGRRTTARYLRKRGLERPVIPWHEWESVTASVRVQR